MFIAPFCPTAYINGYSRGGSGNIFDAGLVLYNSKLDAFTASLPNIKICNMRLFKSEWNAKNVCVNASFK